MDRRFLAALSVAGVLAACGGAKAIHDHAATAPAVPAHCTYGPGGIPDESCTPGVTDPKVTQKTLHLRLCDSGPPRADCSGGPAPGAVCVHGYSGSVRPPVSYTGPLKKRLMTAYGDTDSPSNYELDHRISISLGGDPRAVANLFPEHGAAGNSKDHLEWKLYDELCSDQITLAEAQRQVLAWPGDR